MALVNDIIRERQLAIRRELDRRGIALKVVSYDSKIPYPTLLTYFPGGDRVPLTGLHPVLDHGASIGMTPIARVGLTGL